MNGPLVVDDVELMTRAAIDGVGLAFMGEDHARPHRRRQIVTLCLLVAGREHGAEHLTNIG